MQTIQDSISPVWEEPFRFMIHDPNYQELDIEVQIHSLIMALVRRLFFSKSKDVVKYM